MRCLGASRYRETDRSEARFEDSLSACTMAREFAVDGDNEGNNDGGNVEVNDHALLLQTLVPTVRSGPRNIPMFLINSTWLEVSYQHATMISVSSPVAVPLAGPSMVPENAPEHCPGTDSELAGKAAACEGCANQEICASNIPKGPDPALPFIRGRMQNVRRKILIMSGKGGVGKSTFCAQLGWAFAADEALHVRKSL